jgi:hypothetical protein
LARSLPSTLGASTTTCRCAAPPEGIDRLIADSKGCPVAGAARAQSHKKRFKRKEWIVKKKAMQRKLGQKVTNDSKYKGRSRKIGSDRNKLCAREGAIAFSP